MRQRSHPSPNVVHAAFIPSPIIVFGGLAFSGDGRGFSYDGGTARADLLLHLPINVEEISSKPGVSFSTEPVQEYAVFGRSEQYPLQSCRGCMEQVEGRPSWWWHHTREGKQLVLHRSLNYIAALSYIIVLATPLVCSCIRSYQHQQVARSRLFQNKTYFTVRTQSCVV